MRLPNRKPGKYTFKKFDHVVTSEKFKALQEKLAHIKKNILPRAIKETQKYAENGDFSENAEYQIAKGRLRGLLRTVDELQYQISNAQVIEQPRDTSVVQVGHTVTFSINNVEQTFQILGSSENNPTAGIISYKSPLGSALMGHSVGETVNVQVGEKIVLAKILNIA